MTTDWTQIDWKLVVAAYGAIVATLVAIWQVYVGFRDRGRLKVSALYGRTHPVDVASGAQAEEFIVISVVNHGRRPMTLVSAGIQLSDGRQIVVESDKFPFELSENETADFRVNLKLISNQPITAWVRDSRNKLRRSRTGFVESPR